MRKLLILTCILLLNTLNAQEKYTIKGKVIDNNNALLSWATVVVYDLKDTSMIAGEYSNELGEFAIKTDRKDCLLTASFTGSGSYSVELHIVDELTDLGSIQLTNGITLDEIEVKAKKLELSYEKGVLSYAPNKIYESNSLEFLKTVPLVMTDKDDNFLIKGHSAKVLINGRDTKLSGEELKSYLKTLAPEQILKVEVMTNPSAKYDAEGSAGIINVLLKEKPKGYFGTIAANVFHSEDDKWSSLASGSLSYFSDKFGVAFSLRNSTTNGFNKLFVTKKLADSSLEDPIFIDRSDKDLKIDLLSSQLSLNYFIDETSTISAFLKGYKQSIGIDNDGRSEFLGGVNAFVTQITADNAFEDKNISTGVDYSKKLDTIGTTLSFDYLYLDILKNNRTNQLMQFYEGEVFNDDFALRNINQQSYNIHSIKGDLYLPINDKLTIETGLKYSNVVNNNNLEYIYSLDDEQYVLAPIESNRYDYKENIYAFYLSGDLNFEKVSMSFGNRIEYTDYNTLLENNDGTQKGGDDYLDFFPNFNISYSLKNNNSLSFSFGRRLSRPNYKDLNPSILYSTQYIYGQGNPFLRPEYSSNFEISTKIGRVVTSLFYDLIDQPLGEYIYPDDNANTLFVIKRNLDKSKTSGILASTSFDLFDKAQLRISGVAQYISNSFDGTTNNVFSANGFARLNYKISPSLNANWSSYYTTPFLHGMYKVKAQFVNSAGVNYSIKKFDIGLSVRDIFKAGRWDSQIDTDRYITTWVNRWPTALVNLSLSYQFGNQKVSSKGRYKGKTSNTESNRTN